MKKIIVLICMAVISFTAKAQDFGQILAGSLPDANRYINEYMRPFAEGEIYNLSRGWYSTARTHKFLGFDISINGQFAIVPSGKENFTFNNADYTSFKLNGGASSAPLPTIMGGSSSQLINVTTTVNGQSVSTSFTAPKGIGDDLKKNISFVPPAAPLPVVQIGLGLIKHTDIKLRYFPKTNFSGMEIGIFGLAVQHEFSDYLPFIKKVPFLHLSALAAYSKIDASYLPSFDAGSPVQSSNAVAGYTISAFTLQGIASVKFSLLELYTSVGYSKGTSNIDLKGNYNVTYNTGLPAPNNKTTAQLTDPISLGYNASGLSNSWGIRLNITILKIYADYTFATYNSAGAGIALAIR
ncbi:MAG: DUF6588 family protein [Bacteroidota bacterium]